MIPQTPKLVEECLLSAPITQNFNLEMMDRLNLSEDAQGLSPSVRDLSNDEKMRDASNEFEEGNA